MLLIISNNSDRTVQFVQCSYSRPLNTVLCEVTWKQYFEMYHFEIVLLNHENIAIKYGGLLVSDVHVILCFQNRFKQL